MRYQYTLVLCFGSVESLEMVENAMKINPTKSKVVCFTRARIKEPLIYTLGGTVIPEESSCKHLGKMLCSDLIWSYQVN
jgi:hypothetical protein